MHNTQGLLVTVIALWLRMNLRPFSHKNMSRLLGRLEWAHRPNAGLGPFLAGVYCWQEAGAVPFGNTLICAVSTAVAFCFMPQRFCPVVSCSTPAGS